MMTMEPDTQHDEEHRTRAHTRFRRAKQFLRPLPRRATLHRWPILRNFASVARKTPHLWRFGEREVRMAIYLGSIIAFQPILGFQFVIAFFLAIALRANLLVIMGVQLVTNVFTAVPIYIFTKKLGGWLVDAWGLPDPNTGIVAGTYNLVIGGFVVGLIFGFLVDLIFRFFIFRRLTKSVNVKRMLKS